jgi:hypothetical protein
MLRADSAKVDWDTAKKQWHVHIVVGAEVIKRHLPNLAHDSGNDALKLQAVETAKDEGYELDPARAEIIR